MKRILITGANVGLGKESARQLALMETERIYLGCRNLKKAKAAQNELEQTTGKSIFQILQMDLSDLASVRSAIRQLQEPIDGLVMNAGGMGGKDFLDKNQDGVTQIFATNVLGHVVLAEELLKADMLTKVGLFAGTEAIRGVPGMGIKQYKLKSSSVNEFISIANGTLFEGMKDQATVYGPVKYMGVLWMAALARQYPNVRLVSMSPGGTLGTDGLKSVPGLKKVMFIVMMRFMLSIGRMHRVEVGARRYVDVLMDDMFRSGIFYASKQGVVGPVIDQGSLFPDLHNTVFQDNAYEAIHQFIS